MAKILNFEPRPRGAVRNGVSAGLPALVLIFPGVRYEKLATPDTTHPAEQDATASSPTVQ